MPNLRRDPQCPTPAPSDLKTIALELLKKYVTAGNDWLLGATTSAVVTDTWKAEVAAYKARIKAAEPEIEATTAMGPMLGWLAGTGKTLGQDKLGSMCPKCGYTHLCKPEAGT